MLLGQDWPNLHGVSHQTLGKAKMEGLEEPLTKGQSGEYLVPEEGGLLVEALDLAVVIGEGQLKSRPRSQPFATCTKEVQEKEKWRYCIPK